MTYKRLAGITYILGIIACLLSCVFLSSITLQGMADRIFFFVFMALYFVAFYRYALEAVNFFREADIRKILSMERKLLTTEDVLQFFTSSGVIVNLVIKEILFFICFFKPNGWLLIPLAIWFAIKDFVDFIEEDLAKTVE